LKPKGRKATVVDHARVRDRVKAWLASRPVPAAGDKAEEEAEEVDQDNGDDDDDEEADDDAQSDADSEEDKGDDDDEEAELGDDCDDEVPGDEGHAVEDARKVYTEAARLFREVRQVAAGQRQPVSTSRQRRPPQTGDFEFF
jgi:uncharacterized protein YdaT